MFAYCNNNPISYSDASGMYPARKNTVYINDGGYMKVENELWYKTDDVTVAASFGRYVSATFGVFNVGGTFEAAVDLKGNIQINSSVCFDVTTSYSLSASTGYTGAAFFVPDTSYLSGDTYYLGAGASVPVPTTPLSVTGSVNVGQTVDGYWGLLYSAGITPANSRGGEVHGGYSHTHSWTPQINIWDILIEIIYKFH